ncbi:hypothetical protein [Actinopolymorpha alba]|uniref:hypothetical protein n=1 Tax=Actinopolymorpha alba TaxID=533267 RepID=UPI00037FDEBC|nr:hypothetical protein [Actinopolymorpha alba]
MIQFPGPTKEGPGTHAAQEPSETPNLPAVIEPTSVEFAPIPAGFERPRPTKRLQRPSWLGIHAEHRAAAVDAVRRGASAAFGRLMFEICKGIPTRLWLLIRWFFLGIPGWLALIIWVFAVKERDDVAAPATPQRGKRGGRAVSAGRNADRLSWWRGGVVVVPHLLLFFAIRHYFDDRLQWLAFAPAVIATIVYGAVHDTKPAPAMAAPRKRTDITIESVNAALRAVGILDKPTAQRPDPEGITLSRLPRWVGGGLEVVFDLPASVKFEAVDVVKQRGRLAASFATPLPQLQVEQGAHPGQVVVWQAPHDPFTAKPKEHPLLDEQSWSVFDPVPFGTDARTRPTAVPLVGTHFLVGALPNAGKTMAARILSAGVILDPYAELHLFDGKQGKDWSAAEPFAITYQAGAIRDQAEHLRDLLKTFIADGDARFAAMRGMSDEECPENKLTSAMAANGMPFRWLVIDEGHRHIADEKHGDEILQLLIDYVKGYRAVGFGLLFCTQDADSALAEKFTSLRRVIGSRFALRVMDWQASNMILGDQMNTRGFNAAEILTSQQGTGILRGDADADGQTDAVARLVRTYYMNNAQWSALCDVGRQLRGGSPLALPAAKAEPVYATPADLFALLAERALDVLGSVGASNAHEMGMRLPIKTEDKKVGRRRVYELRRVEVTLGLALGCLTADTEVPPDGGGVAPESGARQLGGSRRDSSEAPQKSPTTTGTEN